MIPALRKGPAGTGVRDTSGLTHSHHSSRSWDHVGKFLKSMDRTQLLSPAASPAQERTGPKPSAVNKRSDQNPHPRVTHTMVGSFLCSHAGTVSDWRRPLWRASASAPEEPGRIHKGFAGLRVSQGLRSSLFRGRDFLGKF